MSATTSGEWDIQYIGFLTGHGGDAVQMLHLASGMHTRGSRVKVIVPNADTSLGFVAAMRGARHPVRANGSHSGGHVRPETESSVDVPSLA